MEPSSKSALSAYRDAAPLATTTRYCELCGLANHPAKTLCDGCDHQLGTPVDWAALRGELPRRRRDLVVGLVLVALMMVLNFIIFQGAGAVVALAPCAWAIWSSYRLWLVRRLLARAPDGRKSLIARGDAAEPAQDVPPAP